MSMMFYLALFILPTVAMISLLKGKILLKKEALQVG